MELRDLYQEIIVDHNRRPRNFGALSGFTHSAQGFNPLCGDKLTLYIVIDDNDVIKEISFEGSGCAISVASASLLTESLKGQPIARADQLFAQLHEVFTNSEEPDELEKLGKLGALAGVRAYPSRVKCASLSWHALNNALHGDRTDENTATTE
ncbi:MAG: SUF system NifU family Fe-S cluster assembly protein [Gammaproteobacteria bacterium]|nr:SUF system NifU family Fe-S cluster assembly protein [Gammaproteobacteria bacterium]